MATRGVFICTSVLGMACLAAGCGREGPRFAEVEGVITCGGRPLGKAEVVFIPNPAQGTLGPRSGGYTDANGHYRLTTLTGEVGAAVGVHSVTVRDLTATRSISMANAGDRSPATGPVDSKNSPKPRFSVLYLSTATTPLRSVEVKAGGNTLNLDLPTPDK